MISNSFQSSQQVQEATVRYEHTGNVGLNQAQLHFLQILSYIKTDETFIDLKRLVRNHYALQLQKEADKYWAEGRISDNLLNEHLRTPYTCALHEVRGKCRQRRATHLPPIWGNAVFFGKTRMLRF